MPWTSANSSLFCMAPQSAHGVFPFHLGAATTKPELICTVDCTRFYQLFFQRLHPVLVYGFFSLRPCLGGPSPELKGRPPCGFSG